MRTLVVEDDPASRMLLEELLKEYGETRVAENGGDAVLAVEESIRSHLPFDLICMDIMMPEMDGQQALRQIRNLETAAGILVGKGAKVLMTTALGDAKNIMRAFREQCDAYLVKPLDKAKLVEQLKVLGLVG